MERKDLGSDIGDPSIKKANYLLLYVIMVNLKHFTPQSAMKFPTLTLSIPHHDASTKPSSF
jgi:hypothetical protein